MKRVTKEVFESVRVNSLNSSFDMDDLQVMSGLSRRTIKNIVHAKDYSDYRKKYCTKKNKNVEVKTEFEPEPYLTDSLSYYYADLQTEHKLINKMLLINLIVTVIGLSIIIGMIAW